MIDGLEALCDEHNAALPELKSFVLPGGTEAAARLHVARTVARRAEIAALEADVNPLARVYLNRVSDLLFILARAANALAGRDEPLWRPGADVLANERLDGVRDPRGRRRPRQDRAHADAAVVRGLRRRRRQPDDLHLGQQRMELGERVRRHRAEVDDDDSGRGAVARVDDVVERGVGDPAYDEALAEQAVERAETLGAAHDRDPRCAVLPDRRGGPASPRS